MKYQEYHYFSIIDDLKEGNIVSSTEYIKLLEKVVAPLLSQRNINTFYPCNLAYLIYYKLKRA